MKSLKKILSIFAAFMMVVGLTAANVKAEGTATITVSNPVENTTYTAYQLFSSTTTSDKGFTADNTQKQALEGGNSPFEFTSNVAGSWNVAVQSGKTDADVIKYLKDNEENLKTQLSAYAHSFSLVNEKMIATVPLGYYFVTTGTGTVITLETVNENKTIQDKNDINFHKTSNTSQTVVNKQVGELVPFEITFNVYKGWKNVTLTDQMSDGLALDGEITVTGIEAGNYTLVKGTPENGFTLTIPTVTDNATVTVTYNGKVQDGAKYEPVATNKANLAESNHPQLGNEEVVTVYTYQLVVNKYDEEKGSTADDGKLEGATFQIYQQNPDEEGAQPLHFEIAADGSYVLTTKELSTEEPKTVVDSVVTNSNGALTIKGLADKDYWVKETVAPDGYNLMTEVKQFNPQVTNNIQTADQKLDVPNKKGSTLPSTGGMGTTMIYIAGAILMVGAAIIFVTNKRMKHE